MLHIYIYYTFTIHGTWCCTVHGVVLYTVHGVVLCIYYTFAVHGTWGCASSPLSRPSTPRLPATSYCIVSYYTRIILYTIYYIVSCYICFILCCISHCICVSHYRGCQPQRHESYHISISESCVFAIFHHTMHGTRRGRPSRPSHHDRVPRGDAR